MRYAVFYIVLLFLIFSCSSKDDTPEIIVLSNNWQFKEVKDSLWNPAIVPGNVHTDLLKNKRIEHPFIKDNELKLQWVSETDWEYKTTFQVNKTMLQKKHMELSFEGLDTYASVYLNDSLLLKANNAFREFQVNAKPLLKAENILRIVFENTSTFEEKEKNKLTYTLPEGERIFTRKAQFQYGWDWGPKINTCGIWRPVKLIAWNDFKIDNAHVREYELTDSIANFALDIKQRSNLKVYENLIYSIYVNDSLIKTSEPTHTTYHQFNTFQIKNPKRWWPHNLGEPYLYDIKVVVRNGKKILDSISIKKGLRTIELVTQEESNGESFYFNVNGVPVYMKGANYIPQNSMQNQVTNSHYEKLLDDVVAANMNMLRVWGGGIYENDIFYDLCDEKGILVWQDFMFACAMYPGDNAFLENVKIEAEQQVKRLRNHASIALWCGNNESSEGWHRWGWQANRSDAEKEEIWNNYLKVFDSILPRTVAKYSNTDYWESSPKFGRGNPKYQFEGDAHDWWIWHDAYPFEHLEEHVPRFMSEFGFQSFPSYETIKYINQRNSLDISSKDFINHQKHTRGFQLIEEYMERDFPIPTNVEDYVYVSQLLQAYGITKGIEAHRRANPYNKGTLYWQLNDCWPVVSWSSIDFFGNWKALHYNAQRSFKNTLISSKVENDFFKTYIVNDSLISKRGTLEISFFDFNGNVLNQSFKDVFSKHLLSTLVSTIDLKPLGLKEDEVFIVSKFNKERSIDYLVKPKDLKLKPESIQKTITKTEKGFQIQLTSKTLQKDVFLFCNDKGHFSDNYFDLLPNETKIILFHSKSKSLKNLKIKTLNSLLTRS